MCDTQTACAGYALTIFIPMAFFCIFPFEVSDQHCCSLNRKANVERRSTAQPSLPDASVRRQPGLAHTFA
jgi:hypothetical protein